MQVLISSILFLLVLQCKAIRNIRDELDGRDLEDPVDPEQPQPAVLMAPVCCSRRASPGPRKLAGGFRPILEFKLKKPLKVCHDDSWLSTTFPDTEDIECCANLAEGEVGKASLSPCLENGYNCKRFDAVKSGPMSCQCQAGLQCLQTQFKPEHERVPAFHTTCSNNEFSPREQYLYGLRCAGPSEFNCATFGAVQDEASGKCVCDASDVCIGAGCQELGADGHSFGFDLRSAFIAGVGKLHPSDKKLLLKKQVTFEMGCAKLSCDDFNAETVGEGLCECRPHLYKFGTVPQDPSKTHRGRFSTQQAWSNNFFCRVLDRDQPRCPEDSTHFVGVESIGDEEPWCGCGRRKCDGPDCLHSFQEWMFPALAQDRNRCV